MSEDNDRRLVDLIIERIEHTRPVQTTPIVEYTEERRSSGSGNESNTYTISQILTGLVVILSIAGGIVSAWVGINNQITAQKISSDLTIAQMHKDITQISLNNKELNSKVDSQSVQLQALIKELSIKMDDLDNTVNQLYNRSTNNGKVN